MLQYTLKTFNGSLQLFMVARKHKLGVTFGFSNFGLGMRLHCNAGIVCDLFTGVFAGTCGHVLSSQSLSSCSRPSIMIQ